MSKEELERALLPYIAADWRSFKDFLFAFNGAAALPAPQGKVQQAMNRLAAKGVVEKRDAKSRIRTLADDMRLYRLKQKRRPKGAGMRE